MVHEAEEHSAEDKKFEDLANARNRADATAHSIRKQMDDLGSKLPASEKEKVNKALNELELAVRGDDKDKIEQAEKAAMEAASSLMSAAQSSAQQAQAQAKAQQQSSQSQSAGESSGQKKDDDVIDAEFEEVDDDKKNK